MPKRLVQIEVRYVSISIGMGELPFRNFFDGSFHAVSHTKHLVNLALDSSTVLGMPNAHLIAHYHKAHGSVRLDGFRIKFDGDLVARGDLDGFNTHVKHPGQIDGSTHMGALNIWNGTAAAHLFGNAKNDSLFGTIHRDTFKGHGGDDAMFGGRGNDFAGGGGGDDQLIMGPGKDTAIGGAGKDFINTGAGDHDKADGGDGNDVIDFGSGRNVGIGGKGRDIFAFDTGLPDTGGHWRTHGRTVIRDFNGKDDVLIFHHMPAGPLPTTGNDSAKTLADLNPGDINGLSWHENAHGALVIRAGDHTVVLKGTKAGDVDLDKVGFSHDTQATFGQDFKDDGGTHVLGTTLHGGIDDIVIDHTGTGAVIHTPDAGMFHTYEPASGAPSYLDFL
jgi:Ca2+-binding RTX toxin-like protein